MTRVCSDCGGAIAERNQSGRCKVHRDAFNRRTRAASRKRVPCIGCGRDTVTGRCASCASKAALALPEARAAISASALARWATPGAREEHSRRIKASFATLSPAERERFKDAGRKGYHAGLALPEVAAKTNSPAIRAKAGRSISATKLAHVPAAYRPSYRDLVKRGSTAAEALALVTDQAAADQRRAEAAERARIAALTPHERNLERVRNGARVMEKVAMPTREYATTLGGVSGGLL